MMINNYEIQMQALLPELLRSFPGWSDIKVDSVEHTLVSGFDRYCPDLLVRACVNNAEIEFYVELKYNALAILNNDQLSLFQNMNKHIVLVTSHVSPSVAQQLKELGISYIDTAGNAYLSFENIYVYQETANQPLLDSTPPKFYGDYFNPTTTRLVFQFLSNSQLIEASYRELGARSGIAVGSVKKAFDILKAQGYISDAGKFGMALMNKKKLFDKWVDSYNNTLRRKVNLGTYSQAGHVDNGLNLIFGKACWSGDYAADILTNMRYSDEKIVYVYDSPLQFIAKNRLKIEPHGSITICQASWNQESELSEGIAPAIVVYADLMWKNDPRSAEVGQHIYKEYIEETLHD